MFIFKRVPPAEETVLASTLKNCIGFCVGQLCLFVLVFWFFKAEFLCVALAAMELALKTRLTLNSQRYTCLCLLGSGIKDV